MHSPYWHVVVEGAGELICIGRRWKGKFSATSSFPWARPKRKGSRIGRWVPVSVYVCTNGYSDILVRNWWAVSTLLKQSYFGLLMGNISIGIPWNSIPANGWFVANKLCSPQSNRLAIMSIEHTYLQTVIILLFDMLLISNWCSLKYLSFGNANINIFNIVHWHVCYSVIMNPVGC